MSPAMRNGEHGHVRFIPLRYDNQNSQASAMELILTLMPEWASEDSNVEFIRFTDGITNTLLKAVNKRPGMSKADLDKEAILLRAYGQGTDILIDREREAENHELLMRYNLAPELLGRFENGMLYRFISGTPAVAHELNDPAVLTAVARRLAQWHATVPCLPDHHKNGSRTNGNGNSNGNGNGHESSRQEMIDAVAPGKPPPNVWTTMQKWILALPTVTKDQRNQQQLLQREFEELVKKLSQRPGLGENGLVFSHCDLLCANVILHRDGDAVSSVSFIDYEYGTPSPAAFDIANHFAEWAGYDCDYSAVPTRGQRAAFIKEYIKTYFKLKGEAADEAEEERKLNEEVDEFRGVPGFYWGIWSQIQAVISEIDFDYANYAETRLGEYWAYKGEADGSRKAAGKELPLREQTWWKNE